MISIAVNKKQFSVVRLNEISTEAELCAVKELVALFSCPLNEEVESFLKLSAFDFSLRNQAITYLVFCGNKFVAYFTLANKLLQVQKNKISKTVLKRLLRVAEDTDDEFLTVPAILVAQLGKNYADCNNALIMGNELLGIVSYFVKCVQDLIGGSVYFLECDSDKQKVIDFYETNGFTFFSKRKTKSKKTQLLQFMKKI